MDRARMNCQISFQNREIGMRLTCALSKTMRYLPTRSEEPWEILAAMGEKDTNA